MNVRQTTALKWTFYALATLLLCFFKRVLLGSVTVLGRAPLPAAGAAGGGGVV